MTTQGVSDYLKIMTTEALVHNIGGVYKPTKKGVQFLHDRFSELRKFIDSSAKDLEIIDICWAIADGDIKKGDRVGLLMEGGYLVASAKRESSSTGRALFDAKSGQDIALSGLEGIARLRAGRIVFGKIPGIRMRGSQGVNLAKLKQLLEKSQPDVIAVSGSSAKALVDRAGIQPSIQFAPLQASIEAAERGLDVLYICSEDHCNEAMSQLMNRNAGSEDEIEFDLIALGR